MKPDPKNLWEFEENLKEWEDDSETYQKNTTELISDSLRKAVIQERGPEALQEHLALNAASMATYETMKGVIISYLKTKKKDMDKVREKHGSERRKKKDDDDIDIHAIKGGKGKGGEKGKKKDRN